VQLGSGGEKAQFCDGETGGAGLAAEAGEEAEFTDWATVIVGLQVKLYCIVGFGLFSLMVKNNSPALEHDA
jgi:hypothetical protein